MVGGGGCLYVCGVGVGRLRECSGSAFICGGGGGGGLKESVCVPGE